MEVPTALLQAWQQAALLVTGGVYLVSFELVASFTGCCRARGWRKGWEGGGGALPHPWSVTWRFCTCHGPLEAGVLYHDAKAAAQAL
jgi:hypothetical protein